MMEGSNDNKGTYEQQGKMAQDRLLEAYEIYNKLVQSKVDEFIKVKEYISGILEKLLQQGKIGRGVILLSRIKSPASVVQNRLLKKDLKDIFGITILTTTQEEVHPIGEVLREEKRFEISSKKQKKEERGYEAIHCLFHAGDKSNRNNETLVECHLQTHENYRDAYPHILYKARTRSGRDLTHEEEKQIIEKIQSMYEDGTLAGHKLSGGKKSRLPQMWVSGFNQQGEMKEQKLNEEMILKIMFPFLDLSKKKHINPESEEER